MAVLLLTVVPGSPETRVQPDMFFFLLLPPIIFEAGFNLKKVCSRLRSQMAMSRGTLDVTCCGWSIVGRLQKRFFRNLSTITLLAVMGTIISTFVIGLIIFAFAKAGAIGIDSTSPLQRYARASRCVACLGSR